MGICSLSRFPTVGTSPPLPLCISISCISTSWSLFSLLPGVHTTLYINYASFALQEKWAPSQWTFIPSIIYTNYPSSNDFPYTGFYVLALFLTDSGSPVIDPTIPAAPKPDYGSGMLNANVFQRAASCSNHPLPLALRSPCLTDICHLPPYTTT